MMKPVYSEEALRRAAKELGYWPVKVIGHANDYWFLVKSKSINEPIFVGQLNKDFIKLGPLGSADAVMAAINLLESQQHRAA